jgi:chloride channel protein, CIC family
VAAGSWTFERVRDAVLPFFRKHWQRALAVRERLRVSDETIHLFLAGAVGVIGGLTNLAFFVTIEWVMGFALRDRGEVVEIAQIMPPWQRAITPSLGGLAAGLVLFWGLRLVSNQGANNIVEVVAAGDGRLRLRSALFKALSSLISIGTGSSIGREGSITQTTAALASKAGQLAHWQPYRLRLLVACGAASGIAAAYNAPIAGAVFACQIVLGNFSMTYFAPVVFASVVATMVSRTFFGIKLFYGVPDFDFTHLSQLPWFLLLGVLSGAVGSLFLVLLQRAEEFFARLKIPIYGRMALGGLIVGLLAINYPQVWGNGYGAIDQILHKNPTFWFILGLFCAKLFATVASVGSGAIGGVFTPTLFLGAALGSLFGATLHHFNLTELPTGAFALVGMGSVVAATIHAPLLAMIMIFEISLNYSVMPPLMLACAIATLTARRLHPDSIYTAPLRRKGVTEDTAAQTIGAASAKTVGEIMREPVPPIQATASFRQVADRFLTTTYNFLPVIDHNDRFIGMIALHDLKEHLNGNGATADDLFNNIIAYDLMRPPPDCLTPNQRLPEVFPVLLKSELRNVPVINHPSDRRLVGSVQRAEALAMLSEAISARGST